MNLPNSMVWIFPESKHLPSIFYVVEIHNYIHKKINTHSTSNYGLYNCHTIYMHFQFFYSNINWNKFKNMNRSEPQSSNAWNAYMYIGSQLVVHQKIICFDISEFADCSQSSCLIHCIDISINWGIWKTTVSSNLKRGSFANNLFKRVK